MLNQGKKIPKILELGSGEKLDFRDPSLLYALEGILDSAVTMPKMDYIDEYRYLRHDYLKVTEGHDLLTFLNALALNGVNTIHLSSGPQEWLKNKPGVDFARFAGLMIGIAHYIDHPFVISSSDGHYERLSRACFLPENIWASAKIIAYLSFNLGDPSDDFGVVWCHPCFMTKLTDSYICKRGMEQLIGRYPRMFQLHDIFVDDPLDSDKWHKLSAQHNYIRKLAKLGAHLNVYTHVSGS